ncbi:MAG: FKBP-type peptidyl-prolyl cis-trans isomerase [Phototrophicaceae bacterium]
MADKIQDGMVVSLAYRLLMDGQEIETADADDPLDYLHGAENIVPGLERALTGKSTGERLTITLSPEDAYGEYDEDNVESVAREDMPDEVEAGMEVVIEDDEGYMYEATVKEVSDDAVILDFNSPLAGKTITYEVEILGMRQANPDELDHGHPHGYDGEDDFDGYEDDE